MKRQSDSDSTASKVRRAFAETGVVGVGRRAARVALGALGERAEKWSNDLLMVEAWARLSDEERTLVQQNAELRGRHAGKRAFIIGNGPSLASQDLQPLAGELTFAVNAFWKHPIVDEWKPTYYVLTDGLFFDPRSGAEAFLRSLNEKVPDATCFIPVHFREFARQHFPEERLRYVALDGRLQSQAADSFGLDRLVPAPPTVLQTATIVAIEMGCSPIYLLGADHSWLAPAVASHFYQGKTLDKLPDTQRSYLKTMRYAESVWHAHEVVNAFAKQRGVEIVNATRDSFLDVYPKCSLESLF